MKVGIGGGIEVDVTIAGVSSRVGKGVVPEMAPGGVLPAVELT